MELERGDAIKARMILDAHSLLEYLDGVVREPVQVTVRSGVGTGITFVCPLSAAALVVVDHVVQGKLTRMERAILLAADVGHTSAKRLAARTSYKVNSRFWAALRDLVRRALLVHTADGYTLPRAD